jgi:photosystem II stability/assembly factor-like uncharacterized protein
VSTALKLCIRPLIVGLACLVLIAGGASAHDASSYGGAFRSRDLGASWLNADVGLFLNAALIVAVDPRDSLHLLAGTDLGLLSSRNGGRSWEPQARDVIVGAAFGLAFSPGGEEAVCAAPSGVFRRDDAGWQPALAPGAALPARALIAAPDGRFYLIGRSGLFVSQDGGRSFAAVAGVPGEMSSVVAIGESGDHLAAVIDGEAMISHDAGRSWGGSGLGTAGAPVDLVTGDAARPQRVWAAAGDRIALSDDGGAGWRSIGRPLPEAGTKIRGIVASADATILLVASHRGIYRSADGGETWILKEDNLPIHLEAGPLARDPGDARIIYAVFSLMPYAEVWRLSIEGGNMLARVEPISLAGGLSFCVLMLIAGALAARYLARRRAASYSPQ